MNFNHAMSDDNEMLLLLSCFDKDWSLVFVQNKCSSSFL